MDDAPCGGELVYVPERDEAGQLIVVGVCGSCTLSSPAVCPDCAHAGVIWAARGDVACAACERRYWLNPEWGFTDCPHCPGRLFVSLIDEASVSAECVGCDYRTDQVSCGEKRCDGTIMVTATLLGPMACCDKCGWGVRWLGK